MSASNATENDLLKMICQGTDPSWRVIQVKEDARGNQISAEMRISYA